MEGFGTGDEVLDAGGKDAGVEGTRGEVVELAGLAGGYGRALFVGLWGDEQEFLQLEGAEFAAELYLFFGEAE